MISNKDIRLSVFFPAYYDEKNIDKVVHKAVEVLEELQLKDYEITIIEDGSPDKTGEVADKLADLYPKVNVIHHEKNKGYGATLWEGFTTAKFEYVFYTDGDNQFDLEELKKICCSCSIQRYGCWLQEKKTVFALQKAYKLCI